ncbi:MAG: hypothetical protein KatS3mg088_266 [Patescibacteria group bacterium]|nr:MAG: hypothetical protein KatS3mg088_266 [Patescibacteria group bacterium]
MVGALTLLLLVFNTVYFFQVAVPSFSLDTFLIWFIVAYFVGHFMQGVANLINEIKFLRFLVPENKKDFDDKQKEILQQAKEYFGLHKQDDSRLWNLCYMLASAKDITGQVQAFNSYYSLYRGWLIVFILESLFLLYFIFSAFNLNTLLLFLASIFFSVIFYRRSKRFWSYTKDKVLETFVIVKTLNL